MREIKFRAWSYETGEMLNWDELLDIKSDIADILKYSYDIELMQYTGLKDKNGKDIYEGDILKIVNNLNEATLKHNTHNVFVKFENGAFVASHGEFFINFSDYNTPVVTFEVVGNIYEDGDILEKR